MLIDELKEIRDKNLNRMPIVGYDKIEATLKGAVSMGYTSLVVDDISSVLEETLKEQGLFTKRSKRNEKLIKIYGW